MGVFINLSKKQYYFNPIFSCCIKKEHLRNIREVKNTHRHSHQLVNDAHSFLQQNRVLYRLRSMCHVYSISLPGLVRWNLLIQLNFRPNMSKVWSHNVPVSQAFRYLSLDSIQWPHYFAELITGKMA